MHCRILRTGNPDFCAVIAGDAGAWDFESVRNLFFRCRFLCGGNRVWSSDDKIFRRANVGILPVLLSAADCIQNFSEETGSGNSIKGLQRTGLQNNYRKRVQ